MFERNFTDEELVLKVQMYPDDNLHYVELQICYAEIERQRALIERAIDLLKHTELCEEPTCINKECHRYVQWLKDVERGGD
jgi:hypothetical protein